MSVTHPQAADTCQQMRGIEPMLGQCWAAVVDGGPTLTQYWVNVSCLLVGQHRGNDGTASATAAQLWSEFVCMANPVHIVSHINRAFNHTYSNKGCLVHLQQANTRLSSNNVSMLGQRRRRWTNIERVLGLCLSFAGMAMASSAKTHNNISLFSFALGSNNNNMNKCLIQYFIISVVLCHHLIKPCAQRIHIPTLKLYNV